MGRVDGVPRVPQGCGIYTYCPRIRLQIPPASIGRRDAKDSSIVRWFVRRLTAGRAEQSPRHHGSAKGRARGKPAAHQGAGPGAPQAALYPPQSTQKNRACSCARGTSGGRANPCPIGKKKKSAPWACMGRIFHSARKGQAVPSLGPRFDFDAARGNVEKRGDERGVVFEVCFSIRALAPALLENLRRPPVEGVSVEFSHWGWIPLREGGGVKGLSGGELSRLIAKGRGGGGRHEGRQGWLPLLTGLPAMTCRRRDQNKANGMAGRPQAGQQARGSGPSPIEVRYVSAAVSRKNAAGPFCRQQLDSNGFSFGTFQGPGIRETPASNRFGTRRTSFLDGTVAVPCTSAFAGDRAERPKASVPQTACPRRTREHSLEPAGAWARRCLLPPRFRIRTAESNSSAKASNRQLGSPGRRWAPPRRGRTAKRRSRSRPSRVQFPGAGMIRRVPAEERQPAGTNGSAMVRGIWECGTRAYPPAPGARVFFFLFFVSGGASRFSRVSPVENGLSGRTTTTSRPPVFRGEESLAGSKTSRRPRRAGRVAR